MRFVEKIKDFIQFPNWMKLSLKPDLVIRRGDENSDIYMRRWWILPRNKLFNVYLHHFLASDEPKVLHNHPWSWVSLIISGGYWEHLKEGVFWRKSWRPRFGNPETFHRVELDRILVARKNTPEVIAETGLSHTVTSHEKPVWTLFVTGRKRSIWGFDCGKKGFVPYTEYVVKNKDGDSVDKGCGD